MPSATTCMSSSRAIEMTERSSTVALVARIAHQRLVDLDRVEGEAGEIGERGKAGAEIVEREADARLRASLSSTSRACSDSPSPSIPVSSSFSLLRLAAGLGKHRAHIVVELVVEQAARSTG